VPERDPIYRVGLRASLLLFVPYFVYNISVLIDYPSIYLVGLPFLAVLSPESNVSIKEFAQLVLNAVLG
jgi:hypothetical protein